MKDNQFVKIFTLMIVINMLTVIFISGLWGVDVGSSAYATGGEVEGLFGVREARVQYHLGLLMAMTSYISAIGMLIYFVLR